MDPAVTKSITHIAIAIVIMLREQMYMSLYLSRQLLNLQGNSYIATTHMLVVGLSAVAFKIWILSACIIHCGRKDSKSPGICSDPPPMLCKEYATDINLRWL